MGFNSRGDVFANGTSEGSQLRWLSPREIAAMPSGDFPGKTVGAVAPAKRQKDNYGGIKEAVASGEVTPGTVQDGVLIDGHTRAAAHLELGKDMAVRATAATVHATKTLRAHLKERAWKAYEKQAERATNHIGAAVERDRPEISRMLHNLAGPTSPFYDRSKHP